VCAESDPVITMGSFSLWCSQLVYLRINARVRSSLALQGCAANSQLRSLGLSQFDIGWSATQKYPVSAPCFPVVDHKHITVNSTTCSVIQKSYTNPVFRAPALAHTCGLVRHSVMNQDRGAVSDTSCDYSPSGRVVNRLGSSASLTRAIRRIL